MATKLSGNQDIDIFKDEKDGKLREVGNQAVWSLSSCKPGKNSYTCHYVYNYIVIGIVGIGIGLVKQYVRNV